MNNNDWRSLVGTLPDSVLARRTGVPARIIGRYRRAQGIPRLHPEARKDEILALLGTGTDAEIAAKVQTTKSHVAKVRRGAGVEPILAERKFPEWYALLGKVRDSEIAEKYQVSRDIVCSARAYRGIDQPPLDEEWKTHLGILPDAEIARRYGLDREKVRDARRYIERREATRQARIAEQRVVIVAPEVQDLEVQQRALAHLRKVRETKPLGVKHLDALQALRKQGLVWHDGPDEAGKTATWYPVRRKI